MQDDRPPTIIELRPKTVRCYGCVQCQGFHTEGDPLFLPHVVFQSKDGIGDVPSTGYYARPKQGGWGR